MVEGIILENDHNIRDDRQGLEKMGLIKKVLLGSAMYFPSSAFKKFVFKMLGADIRKNVYFGPGSLILSEDFHNIRIADGVFVAPGVLIQVNRLSVGKNSHIGFQSLLVGESLDIGAGCNISNRTFIECSYSPVVIEDDVTIGASVMISSHDGAYRQTHGLAMKSAPVLIKKRAFIGNNAIILPGIEIGEKAIVGAGAVVTKNVERMAVVGGVPARVIKIVG